MPVLLYPPLGPLGLGRRFNSTLHGRSRFRPADVPGHNVFNGFTRPGWGDAVDLYCPAGSPVYALEACRQVLHRNDESRLEVVYLQGDGFLVVMAHVEAARAGTGHRFERGQVAGRVRGDLRDPHVHLEIARGQRGHEQPLAGSTPVALYSQLAALVAPAAVRVIDWRTGDVLGEAAGGQEFEKRFPGWALVPGGDHQADQGKLYVAPGRST